jgi:hypothetical protein
VPRSSAGNVATTWTGDSAAPPFELLSKSIPVGAKCRPAPSTTSIRVALSTTGSLKSSRSVSGAVAMTCPSAGVLAARKACA